MGDFFTEAQAQRPGVTWDVKSLPYTPIPEQSDISKTLKSVDLPFKEKLFAYSYRMVVDKVPYVGDPWGENISAELALLNFTKPPVVKLFDTDPIFTFSGLDCVTFVVSIIAAASSNNVQDFINHIIRLNYIDDVITYQNRRHFFETDFLTLPYIKELTQQIMPKAPSTNITIDKIAWLKKRGIECEQSNSACYQREVNIHYIPFESFSNPEILAKLPDIALFATIRTQNASEDISQLIGTELAVAHTGFIINDGGQLIVRHAECFKFKNGACVNGRVLDESLNVYIGRKKERPDTYAGLAIYEIEEVSPEK